MSDSQITLGDDDLPAPIGSGDFSSWVRSAELSGTVDSKIMVDRKWNKRRASRITLETHQRGDFFDSERPDRNKRDGQAHQPWWIMA